MIQVRVRVHPGARVDRVRALPDGSLDIHVRARAFDGRANAAVVASLAAATGLRPRQVQLVRGGHSRQKLIAIDLPSPDELRRRLPAADELGR